LRIIASLKGATPASGQIFRIRRASGAEASESAQAQAAAHWALQRDASLARKVRSGQQADVTIPTALAGETASYSEEETITAYRRLRLKTGQLIRPWLLEAHSLDALYPFQRTGVEWLCGRRSGILADDMGLGKTVQVIFAVRQLFRQAAIRGVLVACTKGLIGVWKREFRQWAPELGVAILSPPSSLREQAWSAVLGNRHVLITNYEQLRKPPSVLQEKPVDVIVADEAHRLRNWDSQATIGISRLPRKWFWALTGTPLQRDLEDFATLLTLVAPKRFAPSDSRLHPSSLRSAARGYVLRRTKDEVLNELPLVTDSTETVQLNPEQRKEYNETVANYRARSGKGLELALLTRLQEICDMNRSTGSSAKLDRIMERLAEIQAREEKAVVFSHRLPPLKELAKRVTQRWTGGAVRLLLGEMEAEQRSRAVQEFRLCSKTFVLAASSWVGSEGLTLVEANHVFFVNQWWNPSSNDQARDRVVRIGQKRPVRVYRYCCLGTLEERLQEILCIKTDLFQDAVEKLGDQWIRSALDEFGIDELLSPK